ncbi:MAG: winged helix-turn-helix transcriptional regulator [Geobacteraceae bacterium]|nr:winged helix-turn-helix transcriptional regulator [Geobacteraceae bacterium]
MEEEEAGGTTEEAPKKRQRTIKETVKETIKETIKEKPKTAKEIILLAIKEKPSISVKELAELCGLSTPGIQYHINNLKNAGLIRHVGATKAGQWEVLTKPLDSDL